MKTYHIIKKDTYLKECENKQFGKYEIDKYGFIHSSKLKGLSKIIDKYLKNAQDYYVLTIIFHDDEVKYEKDDIHHNYPHFYNLIDFSRITYVSELDKF